MSDDTTDDMPQWTLSANERQPISPDDIDRARRLAANAETQAADVDEGDAD